MATRKLVYILTITLILFSFTGDKVLFNVFNDIGKKSSFDKIIKKSAEADIILFGEIHNNPISHWLELELTKEIFKNVNPNIVMGAEMYDSDNQIIINEYLGGHYDYEVFKKEAKIWPNNKTDYLPLLDFAMSNQLSFIATNTPGRYVEMVKKEGFKAFNHLSAEAKKHMAPLPINYNKSSGTYLKIKRMAGKNAGDNFIKSLALKDATMAHFILKNWQKGTTFIHFNGSQHSNNFEGIMWYLKKANPDLKVLTINFVEQENIEALEIENESTAHFIIASPTTMTKTY
jgi:uncharacterized iron-regulated protein